MIERISLWLCLFWGVAMIVGGLGLLFRSIFTWSRPGYGLLGYLCANVGAGLMLAAANHLYF